MLHLKFRQDRRAAAPGGFSGYLFSGQQTFPVAASPPGREQHNPVVNRPFLRSGRPERREGLFVVCIKRRAVLRLLSGVQGLRRQPPGPSAQVEATVSPCYICYVPPPHSPGDGAGRWAQMTSSGPESWDHSFSWQLTSFPAFHRSSSMLSPGIFEISSNGTGRELPWARRYC